MWCHDFIDYKNAQQFKSSLGILAANRNIPSTTFFGYPKKGYDYVLEERFDKDGFDVKWRKTNDKR